MGDTSSLDLRLHLIETITNNFSEDQKVGSGGYADVYKAVYNNEEIAVKKLRPLQGLDDKQFHSELLNLTTVSHKNVVRLIGYCYESRNKYIKHNGDNVWAYSTERVLCFEYMQGGNLEKYIADESCELDWPTCYNIIRGTCEGLNHLHNAAENPIFHLDLKPGNILLDKSMMPKIAGLGLSRIFASSETHQAEILQGTYGYMPPEFLNHRFISKKFDVFSFGVIIIKMVAGHAGYFRCLGMSPKEFIKLVTENWTKRLEAVPGLYTSHVINILRVKTCAEIALRCVDKDPEKRPCIQDIVKELEELDEIKEMSLVSELSKVLSVGRSPWGETAFEKWTPNLSQVLRCNVEDRHKRPHIQNIIDYLNKVEKITPKASESLKQKSNSRMDKKSSSNVLEHIIHDKSAEPMNLPLALLQDITEDFADERQIGRGGFGVVYKEILKLAVLLLRGF